MWRVHSSHLLHSQPVLISSRSSRRHVGKSVPSQRKREFLECLASLSMILRSSRTRMWMSTFVHTSPRSHLANSLDKYSRRECKPGIRGNPPVSNVANCNLDPNFHFCSMERNVNPPHNHDSYKNFKSVFLETLFFKSSTSNANISESFARRRLGEVTIDPKFHLVLGSDHN